MKSETNPEAGSLGRWYLAFAVVGVVSALLFAISYWRDFDREWRQYQDAYASELRAIVSGTGSREVPNPGYVYNQVVVSPSRVDRCQMCHRAVDDPRFAKSPQPLTTHPKIPVHPFEKFGCTACHMGQGRATTVADGHGKVAFWDEPLLPKPFTQASCGACHRGVKLKEAPLLARGRQLYLTMGCLGCHRIHGVGGKLGPELTWVGERQKSPEWHLKHFREPKTTSPGTTMPPYKHLPKKDLEALTVYMLSLRHAPEGLIAAPTTIRAGTAAKAGAGKKTK
jgi:hypothetical protein